MTRFKHDEFAKDLLRTILEPYGKVQIDRPIINKLRRIKASKLAWEKIDVRAFTGARSPCHLSK